MAVRVLVADDEHAITALISDMLTYVGFEVIVARGGAEALALARESKPNLIMLDVMMPDLDGREVCRVLKRDPDLVGIPVVLFSSADEHDVQWHAAGAQDFLQKPFDIRRLPDFVRGMLEDTEGGDRQVSEKRSS
jgi:two-component system, cell cycle response regulator